MNLRTKYSLTTAIFAVGLILTIIGCQDKNMQLSISKSDFNTDSIKADLYTLRNANGMEIKISNYGGIITHWTAPDRDGKYEDIVLGYDSLSGYLAKSPYFGALVGRYGNRIAKGKFVLEGQTYSLPINNGPNSLHGGIKGFDKVLWQAEMVTEKDAVGLNLTYLSKDGEEGFPGNLQTVVRYRLHNDNSLSIDYEATTDKTTIVNLTNHTYFNLAAGKTNILGHEVRLDADKFLPVDKTLIPTGNLAATKGTPFDFTTVHTIGERINDTTNEQIQFGGGYDHCWVLTDTTTALRLFAEVHEPTSGRTLEVLTTEPAVQFYTSNFLDGSIVGKNNITYAKRSAFCLETQHYPDSPNQAQFPTTVLRPGQTYKSSTVYRLLAK